MSGCEKLDAGDDEDDKTETTRENDDYEGWPDSIGVEDLADGWLTVAEAVEAPLGKAINVKGYIIGSTSRNIYNTITAPPFESSTSLILADRIFSPIDSEGNYDGFTEDDLFPVCLTDHSDTRRALNLVDHPEHWHRQIYLFGIKTTYFGLPGMREIMKYEFVE